MEDKHPSANKKSIDFPERMLLLCKTPGKAGPTHTGCGWQLNKRKISDMLIYPSQVPKNPSLLQEIRLLTGPRVTAHSSVLTRRRFVSILLMNDNLLGPNINNSFAKQCFTSSLFF